VIINKAQGKSFKEMGIDLREESFKYVTCSEVGSAKGLHILAPPVKKKHM
jgi:hypothetical protein